MIPQLNYGTKKQGNYSKLEEHSSIVKSVCFSPDGKCFLSGATNHLIILSNLSTGKSLKTYDFVSFSSDGKNILSCAADKTIIVRNKSTGNLITKINEIKIFLGWLFHLMTNSLSELCMTTHHIAGQ